jgi:hypothetical protein
MKTILDILTADSQALVHYHFPSLKEGFKTCWYPSAYRDLSPLQYWKDVPDHLYVYTDVLAIKSHFEFGKPNPFFKLGSFDGINSIEVKGYWVLDLKEVCWNPSKVILNFRLDLSHEAKFYLIHFQLDGRDIPLIYLSFENTNFFFDYILHDELRIDKLIHVNDGGMTLGGSNYKMDYIYLYLDEIGVNEILVDYTFEEKRDWICSFMRFTHFSPPDMRIPYQYERNEYENRREFYNRKREFDRAFFNRYNLGTFGEEYEDPGSRKSQRIKIDDDPRINKLFTDWIYFPYNPGRPYKHQYIRKTEIL